MGTCTYLDIIEYTHSPSGPVSLVSLLPFDQALETVKSPTDK